MTLARLGLLRPDEFEIHRSMDTSTVTPLSSLNSAEETFYESLRELDHLPTRCFDTVYVFYVKRGQHEARPILTNQVCEKQQSFSVVAKMLSFALQILYLWYI